MKTIKVKTDQRKLNVILEVKKSTQTVIGFNLLGNNELKSTVRVKPELETNYSSYYSAYLPLMIAELMDE